MVAIFVGATSGIGEITLRKFAEHTESPRVYFIGQSKEAGDRIQAECKSRNPEGTFTFIRADVSLMKRVDEVCAQIKAQEQTINLLFLSAGVANLDRKQTSEGIHLLTALNYYSRMRFVTNLLPLLKDASSLARVVTVAAGALEGPLDATDFPADRVPLELIRGHIATLITLGLEAVADTAPEVSFVHSYPGTVNTPLTRRLEANPNFPVPEYTVPIEDCGERHVYLSTSAAYPASKAGSDHSVPIMPETGGYIAEGTSGDRGGGMYSVDAHCESASPEIVQFLSDLRGKDMVKGVWQHTVSVYERITG